MRPLFALGVLFVLLLTGCSPQQAAPVPKADSPSSQTVAAVQIYRTWALDQVDQLVSKTRELAAAVEAGNLVLAKKLYAPARLPYERIEPIAETLGDLDPRIDAREGDVPADQWGGFHKLEKILWSQANAEEAKPVARTLLKDVGLLRAKVETAELSLALMATGAVDLLNEVSKTKVTGEEERYSHTDLWDFQGNLEGSQKIFQLLEPAVRTKDGALADLLTQRFGALENLLNTHRLGDGFKSYTDLKQADTRALAAAVDGAADPLGRLSQVLSLQEKDPS